ncbi:predicted protein [Entamoeba histolytica]
MYKLINKNNQLFKEVVETLPNIHQSIDDTTKNYQYYIGSIKNEVFRIKPNETYSGAIKRGEGIFYRIDETERRRKLVIKKSQETINQIEILKNKMSRIIEECKSDEETLSKTRNELIDKIISTEEMKMREKITKTPEKRDKITTEFNKKKEEWFTCYSDYFSMKRRQEEMLQRMKELLQIEEIQQLEDWTNRKVGNILFDSDKDNEDGNRFGGYVNSKIDKVDEWIYDSNSFLFSLESKGRMKRMMKFDIKDKRYAFILYNKSDDGLFMFGNGADIYVYKENDKTQSYCYQHSFEYKGISKALCGKQHPERFTPKRIIVIEMK